MCRLFGMHAGATPAHATFWLVDAPDSLSLQSHANPDGFGIGTFGADATPVVDKAPLAAWRDSDFASAAHELDGTTFVAHVRHASTGALEFENTHPFLQDGRLFAHNGVVEGLEELDRQLVLRGADDLIRGDTDSERVFALITAETARHDGDVGAGIESAIGWISENVPVFSLNFVLTTATDLWALRYPEANTLYLLDRPPGGTGAANPLSARGTQLAANSANLAGRPAVVIASEVMDGDSQWRPVESGELVHVARDLSVRSTRPFPAPPVHLLTLAQLKPQAAASQHVR